MAVNPFGSGSSKRVKLNPSPAQDASGMQRCGSSPLPPFAFAEGRSRSEAPPPFGGCFFAEANSSLAMVSWRGSEGGAASGSLQQQGVGQQAAAAGGCWLTRPAAGVQPAPKTGQGTGKKNCKNAMCPFGRFGRFGYPAGIGSCFCAMMSDQKKKLKVKGALSFSLAPPSPRSRPSLSSTLVRGSVVDASFM